jgi:hypothetical protein
MGQNNDKGLGLIFSMLKEIIQRLEEMDKRLDIIEEQTEQKTFEYEFNDFMTFMFSDLNEGDEYEL